MSDIDNADDLATILANLKTQLRYLEQINKSFGGNYWIYHVIDHLRNTILWLQEAYNVELARKE